MMDLVYICIYLNQIGVFLRGSVTFGKLYHENHVCFGDAMVEAYNIEQSLAKYPRIVVAEKAIIHGIEVPGYANTSEHEMEYLGQLLKKDKNDNWFYLDYLSQDQEIDDPNCYPCVLYKVKKHVINNLNSTRNNRKIFKKYQWFAKYYNDTVRKLYKKSFYRKNDLLIPAELIKYKI